MSSHQIYGPWGPSGSYVWVDADDVRQHAINSEPVAPAIRVQPNIAYASPIDGRPITTWAKRNYDLAASGCVDGRTGKEMAADARHKRQPPQVTIDDVKRAAAQIGIL